MDVDPRVLHLAQLPCQPSISCLRIINLPDWPHIYITADMILLITVITMSCNALSTVRRVLPQQHHGPVEPVGSMQEALCEADCLQQQRDGVRQRWVSGAS